MKTHKKCKGSGKALGYGCGELVDVRFRKYGLGTTCCYANWLYSSEEGKQMIEKATLKATAPRVELEKATNTSKDRKRLPVVLKQTQVVFNEFIRLRDKDKPCVSSGFPLGSLYDAGHCYSVKQFSGLRFNEYNVHAQSIGDNRFNEGNVEQYILNLESRIGSEQTEILKELAIQEKRNPKKWTIEEVLEIKKEYQTKLKALKQ
jgi:hypothetical protein